MTILLLALTTPGVDSSTALSWTVGTLRSKRASGEFNRSFLRVEDFDAAEQQTRRMFSVGANDAVEVLRINVARWWMRYGAGQGYDSFLFVDSRDTVVTSNVFDALNRSIEGAFADQRADGGDGALDAPPSYVFAASEEFPFFRQPREGLQWNVMVHATTFGTKLMHMMQRVHLDDYAYYRLINSGVVGGTYSALVDLLEIWGSTTASVPSKTFGVDQPVLGGLMYFGLHMTRYPHHALLLSGSDGPLRHLYPDGGTDSEYPYMRLRDHNNRLMWSMDAVRDESLLNTTRSVSHLNCRGEVYALIHQADRYLWMWKVLTRPWVREVNQWARQHGVEFKIARGKKLQMARPVKGSKRG